MVAVKPDDTVNLIRSERDIKDN